MPWLEAVDMTYRHRTGASVGTQPWQARQVREKGVASAGWQTLKGGGPGPD